VPALRLARLLVADGVGLALRLGAGRGRYVHGSHQSGRCAVTAPAVVDARLARLREVASELARAREKFPAFHSSHEGYAVLLEEVDELWDLVKTCKGAKPVTPAESHAMRSECIQIAAMALRFIEDVCDG
jgi:hypothetical protein